jgi:hypothetical protein
MAEKAINLGELAIAVALKTAALEQGLNEVKKQLNKHTKDVQSAGKGYDALAVVAGVAFYKVASAIKQGVDAYNQYQASMTGLKSVAEGTGNSFQKSQKFIQEFTSDGLVPASDAAASLKNLLARGFGFDQASDIMNRLKDSAAFARQGTLSLGQAIEGATSGLKNSQSQMVDNAGVTRNLSLMWEDYAKTIGKTSGALTESEKAQAEYVGIMEATKMQVGDAAKLANEFAGSQARASAESLKLKEALGGAVVPILNTVISILTPILQMLTKFISTNPAVSGAIIAMVSSLALGVTALMSLNAALKILKPAITGVTAAMAANPILLAVMAGLALTVGAVTLVTSKLEQAKKVQDEYNTSIENYNKIKSEGVTVNNVVAVQEEAQALRELINERERLNASMDKFMQEYEQINNGTLEWTEEMGNRSHILYELEQGIKKNDASLKGLNVTYDEAKERVSVYSQKLEELKRAQELLSLGEIQTQSQTIAQKRVAIMETENLIATYKKAEVGSRDWQEAQEKLAEKFPQFSSASGIAIEAIEALVNAENNGVKNEWNALQQKIEIAKQEVQLQIAKKEAILETMSTSRAQMDLEDSADSYHKHFATELINRGKTELDQQKQALAALDQLGKTSIDKIQGVKPVSSYTGNSGSGSSSNSAYNEALKLYEHRKYLQQLTMEDEVNSLETILAYYAKTSDEKMAIEEKIFSVKQSINDRDKAAQEKSIEDAENVAKAYEDAMQRKTRASLNYIEDKKTMGELTLEEEVAMYDSLLTEHKAYIDQVINDEQLASDVKQGILDQEADTVRDIENKKYNIRKEYADKERQEAVDAVNKTSERILAALRNKYESEKALKEKSLNDDIKALDKWKDESLKRIESVYDSKINLIEETSKAQEKALQREIDAIDEQSKQRDRTTIDTEQLDKIKNLQQKIAYEHDEFNKVELQKQLDNLIKERGDRLYKEQLEDKKDSLKKQIDAIKENADEQKKLLEEKKQSEIDAQISIYNSSKVLLEQSLVDVNTFYTNKLSAANLAAEQEVLLMNGTQATILDLLQNYYPNLYEVAGQTLGEKLVDGFQSRVMEIQSIISSLIDQVNSAKAAAVSAASSVLTPTTTSENALSSSGATVNQTNIFNIPVESPAEVARRIAQTGRQMATLFK